MLLASHALSPWVTPPRAAPCAVWVTHAVVDHGGGLDDALLAAEWAARESGCNPRALSPDGQDCSIMQMRGVARRGHTCAELVDAPELSIATWLEDLDELRDVCGTTRGALGALAGGHCGDAAKLVSSRCRQAGVKC